MNKEGRKVFIITTRTNYTISESNSTIINSFLIASNE